MVESNDNIMRPSPEFASFLRLKLKGALVNVLLIVIGFIQSLGRSEVHHERTPSHLQLYD